jgi:hypothetical protein
MTNQIDKGITVLPKGDKFTANVVRICRPDRNEPPQWVITEKLCEGTLQECAIAAVTFAFYNPEFPIGCDTFGDLFGDPAA